MSIADYCWNAGVSLSEVVFSDDCWWFGRTAAEVSRLSTVAHLLSLDSCAPSNQSKMHYTVLRLSSAGAVYRSSGSVFIHGNVVSSSPEVPVVVGVSLQPGAPLPKLRSKFCKRADSLCYFVLKYSPSYLLLLRSVLAYLVSLVDFVSRGSRCLMFSSRVFSPRLIFCSASVCVLAVVCAVMCVAASCCRMPQ